MLLKELLKTENNGFGNMEITGITCDSRRVEKGNIFVCINGTLLDGHRFAEDALQKGAALVITERRLGLEREITLPDTDAA